MFLIGKKFFNLVVFWVVNIVFLICKGEEKNNDGKIFFMRLLWLYLLFWSGIFVLMNKIFGKIF